MYLIEDETHTSPAVTHTHSKTGATNTYDSTTYHYKVTDLNGRRVFRAETFRFAQTLARRLNDINENGIPWQRENAAA